METDVVVWVRLGVTFGNGKLWQHMKKEQYIRIRNSGLFEKDINNSLIVTNNWRAT
jgi:hypothetical protein